MSAQSKSDEELVDEIRGAAEGDLRPFETLVHRYQGKILTNCRYLTSSPNDAEDLAQEVFAKAYFGLLRFEGRSSFKTWIHRIKINHCLNYLQRRKGKTFVALDEPEAQETPGPRVSSSAERELRASRQRRKIGHVLDNLNETLRIPLIMRDLDGLSYDEIAEHLGIGLSAVKMRIKRAREEFRRRWDELKENEVSGEARGAVQKTVEL